MLAILLIVALLLLLNAIVAGAVFFATKLILVGDNRFVTCFKAVLAASILGIFPAIMGLHYAWVASALISIYLYSRFLQTNLWPAAGIYVLSTVMLIGLGIGVALVAAALQPVNPLNAMLNPDKFVQQSLQQGADAPVDRAPKALREIIIAADDVCRCGTDQHCATQKMQVLERLKPEIDAMKRNHITKPYKFVTAGYHVKAMHCVESPAPYQPPEGVEQWRGKPSGPTGLNVASLRAPSRPPEAPPSVAARNPQPQPERQPQPVAASQFGYVDTPVTELDKHLGHKIRVLTRTGMTRIGFLKEVHSHRISVGRSRGKQGLTYEISLHDIERLDVWDRLFHKLADVPVSR